MRSKACRFQIKIFVIESQSCYSCLVLYLHDFIEPHSGSGNKISKIFQFLYLVFLILLPACFLYFFTSYIFCILYIGPLRHLKWRSLWQKLSARNSYCCHKEFQIRCWRDPGSVLASVAFEK